MKVLVENLSCATTHVTSFGVALDRTNRIAIRRVCIAKQQKTSYIERVAKDIISTNELEIEFKF